MGIGANFLFTSIMENIADTVPFDRSQAAGKPEDSLLGGIFSRVLLLIP